MADRVPVMTLSVPFAKELFNAVTLILSLATLIPMTWLYHGSLRASLLDDRVPLLFLLFWTLGTLTSAIVKIPLGLDLARYPDELLSEYLVADVYVLFAGLISTVLVLPFQVINLSRLFPTISNLRFIAGLALYLLAQVIFIVVFSWIAYQIWGPSIIDFFESFRRET
jgi:hypothetical protein